jgi:phosphoglycerol geranylgeranyltransferase
MSGRVEKYLKHEIRKDGGIHLTLIDPEKAPPKTAAETARRAEKDRTAAIMVGGSTVTSTQQLEDTVIRAPFAGIVTVKNAQPGEMISPSA